MGSRRPLTIPQSFFTGGRKTLNDTIVKCFNWFKNIGIILDWHRLEKKCKEQLSMAMKGRIVRNDTLERLLPLLGNGLTDKAIALLEGIKPIEIEDEFVSEKLVQYQLGLRNSSDIGEKMNELIVSERQKHNGMSWSKPGSVALASVTALKKNRETKNWFEKQELEFKLVATQVSSSAGPRCGSSNRTGRDFWDGILQTAAP